MSCSVVVSVLFRSPFCHPPSCSSVLATPSCNSFLQVLIAAHVCKYFLQLLLDLPTSFLQLLFATPLCHSCSKFPVAALVCNSFVELVFETLFVVLIYNFCRFAVALCTFFLQLLCEMPFCNFLQFIFETPSLRSLV